MLVRVNLEEPDLARVDRLAGVVPLVTKRTALVAALVRLGLAAAERDPRALVEPVGPAPGASGESARVGRSG